MRASLIAALFILSSCSGDDGNTPEGKWQLLAEGRPSSLLSVWASSTQDVWVVGGREGTGLGPTVFHYDGATWTKLDPGAPNVDLWWVYGFANDAVFFGGSGGTIIRYRDGEFAKLTTPSTDIVFGMWGASPDDMWAVGGQTNGRAFVWRLQGSTFVPVSGMPATLPTGGAVWKVTGRAADDVWMSCSQGLILHWDGQSLSSEQVGGAEESLFSIGCHASGCVAAGTNITNGVLYQNDGQGWTSKVPTPDGPVWRGVTPTGEHPYVVGMFGSVVRLTPSGWVSDPHGLTTRSLHAAWATADGSLFAAGGQFDSFPTKEGVLLYKGAEPLPELP